MWVVSLKWKAKARAHNHARGRGGGGGSDASDMRQGFLPLLRHCNTPLQYN